MTTVDKRQIARGENKTKQKHHSALMNTRASQAAQARYQPVNERTVLILMATGVAVLNHGHSLS